MKKKSLTKAEIENAKKHGLKFAVNSRFFDSGRVESWIETCNPACIDSSEERPGYDFYFDVFETLQEAEEYMEECLAEGTSDEYDHAPSWDDMEHSDADPGL